ncbi:carbonic anhydrase [Boletus coccyginus]|nr:carbonic anhydrase [Boletus coccyginus]
MSGILKSDLYKIIPLTGGYSPVGVELILPASQFVGLNATVAEWEVRQVYGNAYRLSVGSYQNTGALDHQVNASIHSDSGQNWYIIYSQHDDAYLHLPHALGSSITADPQGSSGWTVDATKSQLKIAPIIATTSIPPQYLPNQLFKFCVQHASNTLSANVRWAQNMHQIFPQYFPDPKVKQAPKILWIGCSDSRVQESDAMTALPGTAFVHRNIANQFHFHTESNKFSDANALSVVEYAVGVLGVQHVVIVGHDHCGGVISAIDTALSSTGGTSHDNAPCGNPADETSPNDYIFRDSLYQPLKSVHGDQLNDTSDGPPYPRLVAWLEPLVRLVKELKRDGKLPANPEERLNFVIGESVKLQINNFAKLDDFVRRRAKRPVWVHGWVYDFTNGVIRDLQVTRVLGGHRARWGGHRAEKD